MVAAGNECLLVVEGQDDKHVVRQIRDRCLPDLEFDVKDSEGFPHILKSVVPEIKAPGRRSVGFVLDGNSDPQQRWEEVRGKLVEAGLAPPLNLDPDGVILKDESGPAVGVWLMPDNGSSGEIEDFVIKMIKDNDPVWPLAQSYIDGIPEEYRKFPPIKSDKAKLYAWLSTRKKPSRMGAAIGAGDLNTETQLNSSFMSWLSNLFGQV